MISGGDPFYPKFLVKLTAFERNRGFSNFDLFSAITSSEKSSVNTNRKPNEPKMNMTINNLLCRRGLSVIAGLLVKYFNSK